MIDWEFRLTGLAPIWILPEFVYPVAAFFLMTSVKSASILLAKKCEGADAMNSVACHGGYLFVTAFLDVIAAIGTSLIATSLPA